MNAFEDVHERPMGKYRLSETPLQNAPRPDWHCHHTPPIRDSESSDTRTQGSGWPVNCPAFHLKYSQPAGSPMY